MLNTGDDDFPKLQFSLLYGLRLLLPTSNYYNQHAASLEDLFPELLQDMLPESPRGRVECKRSSQDPQKEIENSRQYRQMAAKIKAHLAKRRAAVVRANTKGLGRRKEIEVKMDVDAEFQQPGIHVRPKPYKSVSSL